MKLKCKKWLMPVIGLFIGFINGFFGGGGGMLLVPSLKFVGGVDQKKSQATAISIILPLSLISGLVYTFKGVYDLGIGLSVGGGVIAGGVLGACLLKKISNKALAVIFYLLMLAAGIRMVIAK
ncbi:MAG: TSUP family transporter [Christensenellales bacterium]|jgi:uncharacterized membrane protein YfcA